MASVTYTVMQTFGDDGSNGYKAILQRKEGQPFFVWYAAQLGIKQGDQVIITTTSTYIEYGDKINNPKNGYWARINKTEVIK